MHEFLVVDPIQYIFEQTLELDVHVRFGACTVNSNPPRAAYHPARAVTPRRAEDVLGSGKGDFPRFTVQV